MKRLFLCVAMLASLSVGLEAISIKDARAKGWLKPDAKNKITYNGLHHPLRKLDNWDGLGELARDYPKLNWLSLRHNKLPSPPKEIGQFKNLQVLDLFSNRAGSLPVEIGGLKKLYSLGLGNNRLERLPRELRNLKELRWLNVGSNRLNTEQPLQILSKMTWLRDLYIGKNHLKLKQKLWLNKRLQPHVRVHLIKR